LKRYLSQQLKTMLNALAAQHFGDYLNDADKRAALEKVLADIEREKTPQQDEPPSQPPAATAPSLRLTLLSQ
jgi:hypothetical protein